MKTGLKGKLDHIAGMVTALFGVFLFPIYYPMILCLQYKSDRTIVHPQEYFDVLFEYILKQN